MSTQRIYLGPNGARLTPEQHQQQRHDQRMLDRQRRHARAVADREAVQRELDAGPTYSGSDLLPLAEQLRRTAEALRSNSQFDLLRHRAAILTATAIRCGVLDGVQYTTARAAIRDGFTAFAVAIQETETLDRSQCSREPEISACAWLADVVEAAAIGEKTSPSQNAPINGGTVNNARLADDLNVRADSLASLFRTAWTKGHSAEEHFPAWPKGAQGKPRYWQWSFIRRIYPHISDRSPVKAALKSRLENGDSPRLQTGR